MNYPELIRERRSIREFANTQILDEQRSELTSESDVKIDVGIAMRSYVASYETNQEADGMWKMGVPEDLPDIGDTSEYKPVAYCNLIGF